MENGSVHSQESDALPAVAHAVLSAAEEKIRYLFKQQKLLADISQLLNSTASVRAIVGDVLGLLGEHTNVSRVYIFENAENGLETSNTYEWCNTGIVPQKENLQGVPYELIPSWKYMLMVDGRVFSTDITTLPEDISAILEPQAIKSILVYPLYVQNGFYGFIGFDECTHTREWPEDEMNLLLTVANIISNAFERSRVLSEFENSELRLKLALDGAKEGLWDWNNETGGVYFSDTWCTMLGYEPGQIDPTLASWERLVHPDDMADVTDALTKHLNGETEFYETIHRMRTADGGWKWILDHGMVVGRCGPSARTSTSRGRRRRNTVSRR